jgi:hypothetical protein
LRGGVWRSAGRHGRGRLHRDAVDVFDRRLVSRKFVAGEQHVLAPSGSAMDFLDNGFGVLDRPRTGDDSQDQAVLSVDRHVIPVVSFVVIVGVFRVAVGLFLGDE